MRKKLIALIGAGLVLTGCTSTATSEPGPSPAPTVDPNVSACAEFEGVWLREAQQIPEYLADWEETRDSIDAISLTAQGDVKTRMQTFVSNWPEMLDFFVWHEFDEANRMLGDIERACAASNADIAVQVTTSG